MEVAYLYLNHSLPFVLQIFRVFRRHQLSGAPIIPEDEEMKETCIYLRTLKGGFTSNYFIPVIRREPAKKVVPPPILKKAETFAEDQKPYQAKPIEVLVSDINDSRNQARNDNKRVASLPRQQLTSTNWREAVTTQPQPQSQSLTRKKTAPLMEKEKENTPIPPRPPREKDFSKTATDGFRR